jgi:hypothetical protein
LDGRAKLPQIHRTTVLAGITASYTNCVLESTVSLAPAGSWSAETTMPVVEDTQQTVTLNLESATNRFFRLRYQ